MGFFSSSPKNEAPVAAPSKGNENDIRQLEQYIDALTTGNYTAPVPRCTDAGLQRIATAIGKFAEAQSSRIRDIVMAINEGIYEETNASENINQIVSRFKSIDKEVKDVIAIVDNLQQAITDLANTSSDTARQSEEGREAMKEASEIVEEVTKGSQVAQEGIKAMTSKVSELHDSTANIDGLVDTINGIAGQTNLLALNASIEAARAGEHGRGFAVVADEVRKLADQSKDSVGQIQEQLGKIRTEVTNITQSFADMDSTFEENAKAINETGEQTKNLVKVFDQIGAAINNLAPLAEEEAASFGEMNVSLKSTIENIGEVNDLTDSCNVEVYHSLDKINQTRVSLASMQLPYSQRDIIALAKTDHTMWRALIYQMIWGNVNLDASKVSDHTACRLGKWYNGAGRQACGGMRAFQDLDSAHSRFHRTCAQAIDAYKSGDMATTMRLAKEISDISVEVIGYLDELQYSVN